MKYDHKKIEKKWQKYWAENPKLFAADDKSDKPKQYILDMFPYPSGDGLHTGHVESYTATDIISRYLRMSGFNVLHPQGFDAFGLPAENYAIKTKIHPAETTKKAITNFKKQMNMMGFSYDWSREVISADPEYYKWTQWFFLLLYKNGLAFKSKGKVNWCDSCQTVLANEQAEGGVCDRCGKPVRQKDLEQWYFKITDFIEDTGKTSGLLSGLDKIDWPESTKAGQRNWIGKSEGAQFKMEIVTKDSVILSPKGEESKRSFVNTQDDKLHLSVFTTRLDTVFGMTFALIAPEHKLVQELKSKITNWSEVEKYIVETKKKSELQRMAEVKEKTGVELEGIKVLNPFTKKTIPLFASDFVLAHYGTGAVMAVPAHDERDFAFAKKFGLPIDEVVKSVDGKSSVAKEAYTEDGVLINSGEHNGLTSAEARKKLTQWLQKEKIGQGTINYKLRDWLVSRQRYWGAPIPIIYCDKCGEVPVPEKDLPVLLPNDVDFMPTGESPLAISKKFHDIKCPKCGAKARRESDTMDTFVCSSWYYLRYADSQNDKEFASKEMLKKWLPVDLYVGGAEHTVLHLLYSRFFTKVLHKLGYIDFDEPFSKMRHQGIILAPDGRKMSKSWGNIINPDDVVAEYGADALRLYEMFMGPLEEMKPWNTKGIVGVKRFLDKTWNYLSADYTGIFIDNNDRNQWIEGKIDGATSRETEVLLHKTIKKVSEDIESLKFNTAISQLMVLRNSFYEIEAKRPISEKSYIEPIKGQRIKKSDFEKFIILLAPFAPFIAEEIWQGVLKHKGSIFNEEWPKYNKDLVNDETIQMPIQINGKVRAVLAASATISEEDAKKLALSDSNVIKWLEGKEPKKVIFVKGRLVNIVV
ncbi:MAG TPA: leucine--tRNA ligase [Candidatus Portnoybacteria bacterium]|nr:leucine--tRNA ligase [Candidatus Portnoybacteria bacterium]